MNEFDQAIQEHIYLYKEGIQDKYYQGAKWAWQHQQAKVDDLQKRVDEYKKLTISIRNEFDLWSDDSEFADVIEAQIENLEALRGAND